MKKNGFYLRSLAAIIVFGVALLLRCDDNDKGKIELFIVSSKLVPDGTNPPTEYVVYMMELTSENSGKKYHVGRERIKGFEYREGYEYKIKVRITPVKNPPMDDYYLEAFELIEIISMIERE